MILRSRTCVIIPLLIGLCWATVAHGQSRLQYHGAFEPMVGMRGYAEFEFKEQGRSRIKDGSFHFRREQRDTLRDRHWALSIWEGTYQDDERHGAWTFEDIEHEFELLEIVDYRPVYRLHSTTHTLQAQYVEGVPEGPWSYQVVHHEEGDSVATSYELRANFVAGKLDGQVWQRGLPTENGVIRMEGEARQGLMVGTWIWELVQGDDTLQELRSYQDGILLSLMMVDSIGDTLHTLEFPHSPKLTDYLDTAQHADDLVGAPTSFVFSDGYPRTSAYITAQLRGALSLEEATHQLLQYQEGHWQPQGLIIGANRMYYPLNTEEEAALQAWPGAMRDFEESLLGLEDLRVEEFLYSENDTLFVIQAWLQSQRALSEYMEPWDRILTTNELPWYYREGLLPGYLRSKLGQDSLHVQQDTVVITYDYGEEGFVQDLIHNLEERVALADSLREVGGKIIDAVVRLGQVKGRVMTLVSHKRDLDSVYAIAIDDVQLDTIRQHVLEDFIDGSLSHSIATLLGPIEDVEHRARLTDSLSDELRMADRIYTVLRKTPERRQKLDEAYTAYTFDPYTFSENVPVRLHRRLYNGAAAWLVDQLLLQAWQSASIEAAYEQLMLLAEVQQRLLALASDETEARRIDRRMKRSTTVPDMLRLLDL